MQTSRNVGVTALLLGAFLLLSGCGTSDTNPTATPADVSEPLFASEEEALAAAEEVFREYTALTDEVLQEGGADPDRLKPFVTASVLDDDVEFARDFASAGRSQLGSAIISKVELQQYSDAEGVAQLMLNACIDLTAVSFTPPLDNAAGNSAFLEVTLEATRTSPVFRVSGVEPWSSTPDC